MGFWGRLGLVFLSILTGTAAEAQTFHATVRGRVLDPAGAPISAGVELADEQTGLTRSTTTTADGLYVIADVLPGDHRLRIAAAGFKMHQREHLRVGARAVLTIDVILEIGNIVEVVTVEAPATAAEATSAGVSLLLDRSMLDRLPSAGRNIFIAGALATGVLPTGDAQFVRQQDQSNSSLITMAGGPRRNNTYVFDGIPIADIVNRATLIPNFQAVEEMRVQLSTYDAEIGRTSGGVFNVIGRSGSNAWRGTALYQNRPDWAIGRLYFAEKNDIDNPDTYYHLYGGGVGGPIRRDRTFFWASTEGYRSASARNTVLVFPTEAERRGDFSRSGVTIYDPLTTRPDPARPGQFVRDPFPNNQIPANRINPVSQALLQYVPQPTSGKLRPAVASIVDRADQLTGKVTHRVNDALTASALYAWYESMEPDAAFYGGGSFFDNPADPGGGAFVRGARVLALNGSWVAGPRTVLSARYGFTSLTDDNRPAEFDPGPLGFDARYLAAVPLKKFPNIGVQDYGRGGSFLGDRTRDLASYYSRSASVAMTTVIGRHAAKVGGDYRVTGSRFGTSGGMGNFNFSREFTFGPNPNAPAAGTGDAFASFLLGSPASGGIYLTSPLDVYLHYWSGFVQDEVRVTPRLTIDAGLRYEYETGLRERGDRFITGWAYDAPFPAQVGGLRPDGTPLALTGGVLYAGQQGAPRQQGDPNPWQFAPRAGVTYAIDGRTLLRGGYGLFWAPSQGISADEGGTASTGYNVSTGYIATGASPFIPCTGCSLVDPFPAGFAQPTGNTQGRLTGVGSSVTFVDPTSHLGRMHRYSADVQHDWRGGLRVGAGYVGALGRDLSSGIGGYGLNINQIHPRYASLGTALQEPVPNPFLGTPLAVGILAAPTVPRGQLLRPYPQFDTVTMRRPNLARSRYDALVLTADRRLADGWAAYANYTWSHATDNQYSESNFFAGGSGLLDNYDVEREYSLSVTDTAHRVTFGGTIELPFGMAVSASAFYQSGFPVTVHQSPNNTNLMGSSQRPDVVEGVNAKASGEYDAACGCIRWLNPDAWSQAAPFTFGNAPRADGRVRTRGRRNLDVAIDRAQRVGAHQVILRAELINALNTPDLRGPSITFGDPSFGQIREAAGFPRMLQVSARLAW